MSQHFSSDSFLQTSLSLAIQQYRHGQFENSAHGCRAILAVIPDQAETMLLWGSAEAALGRDAEARSLMVQAILLKPDLDDAYTNLALLRQRQGKMAEALVLHSRAIRLCPGVADHHIDRALVLNQMRRYHDAERDFAVAARLAPDDPRPINLQGSVLRELGQIEAAQAAHRRAIALEPANANAHFDLGHALYQAGDISAASAAYCRAYRIAPNVTEPLGGALVAKLSMCDWEGYQPACQQLLDIIDHESGVISPLLTMLIDASAAQQYRAARTFHRVCAAPTGGAVPSSAPAPAMAARNPKGQPGSPKRRLTIGYFSADFRQHAVAYLVAELFELHDRGQFRIIAYSYGPDDGGPMRNRLVRAFDAFRDISSMSRDDVAALCAADDVDILVDLMGYTRLARLDLLTRRLAPVQVSFLGFPGTMGCDLIDYIIGDRFVTPMAHQAHYHEQLVLLPDCYQINDRQRPLPHCNPHMAPAPGFVFSAFNGAKKITPAVFGVWMRLLVEVPDSVLWLLATNPFQAGNLRREAAVRGVDPDRLIFAPELPLEAHLARYRAADLGLDTFPYNGHTTTSDALWCGVPVVTRMGDTFASRVSAGLLNAAGLPELVTSSLAEYEELAMRLAREPALLAAYRLRLEATRLAVPLFDSYGFTRALECAYRVMMDRHSCGLPPQSFEVPPLHPGRFAPGR